MNPLPRADRDKLTNLPHGGALVSSCILIMAIAMDSFARYRFAIGRNSLHIVDRFVLSRFRGRWRLSRSRSRWRLPRFRSRWRLP